MRRKEERKANETVCNPFLLLTRESSGVIQVPAGRSYCSPLTRPEMQAASSQRPGSFRPPVRGDLGIYTSSETPPEVWDSDSCPVTGSASIACWEIGDPLLWGRQPR